MKTLTYGQITDNGRVVFQSFAKLDDENRLLVTFEGSINVDNPYRYLSSYLDELAPNARPPSQGIAIGCRFERREGPSKDSNNFRF